MSELFNLRNERRLSCPVSIHVPFEWPIHAAILPVDFRWQSLFPGRRKMVPFASEMGHSTMYDLEKILYAFEFTHCLLAKLLGGGCFVHCGWYIICLRGNWHSFFRVAGTTKKSWEFRLRVNLFDARQPTSYLSEFHVDSNWTTAFCFIVNTDKSFIEDICNKYFSIAD